MAPGRKTKARWPTWHLSKEYFHVVKKVLVEGMARVSAAYACRRFPEQPLDATISPQSPRHNAKRITVCFDPEFPCGTFHVGIAKPPSERASRPDVASLLAGYDVRFYARINLELLASSAICSPRKMVGGTPSRPIFK